MEIDITAFFENSTPSEFSASIAERGRHAAKETWDSAKSEAAERPILQSEAEIAAFRDHMRGYGAWDDDEINAWDTKECNALFIQLISGDMREGGLDDGADEAAWAQYEQDVEAGTCSGCISRGDDGFVYYYLGD